MWSALYQKESFERVSISREQEDSPDPVSAFVYMEIKNVKEVLATVNESVTTISRILSGSEMLTAKSQKEATELLKGGVPTSWARAWEGPEENPTAWIGAVNRKANALLKWMQKIQGNQLLQSGIDLSDLFHPETFLNALR